MSNNNSRIGFEDSEYLGNGLKAIYEKAKMMVEEESYDHKNFMLGVDFALNSNTTLMASYLNGGDLSSADDFDGSDSGAKAWNLGVNYKLPKRTSVQGICIPEKR